MKSTFIDCSGLSCPEPVLKTRKLLQEKGLDEVKVKVSSSVARDNVKRAAHSLGWKVQVTEENEHFILTLTH